MLSEQLTHIHLIGIQQNEQNEWLRLYVREERKSQSDLDIGGGLKTQPMFPNEC